MLIDRYLARAVLGGIAVTAMVFAGLFLFIDFVRELKQVGVADYTAMRALVYVALNLPQRLYELAPSVILVGTLLSLGAMASGSELVVMRASGMSIARITRSVVQAGLLIIVLVVLLGEYVAPYSVSKAQAMRVQAMNQSVMVGDRQGVWSRDGERYIHIRKVLPDRELRDIHLYELDASGKLKVATHIERARPQGQGWLLSQVSTSLIDESGVQTRFLPQQTTNRLVKADLFDVLKTEPEDMSARDLYAYANYLQQNNLDADVYRLQFWMKLFTPITCMVMLLLALPLVFGAQARSGGAGQRVVIGLSIGIVFYVLNQLVNHLGLVYGAPPLLSAALPPLLAAAVVIVLLRRA